MLLCLHLRSLGSSGIAGALLDSSRRKFEKIDLVSYDRFLQNCYEGRYSDGLVNIPEVDLAQRLVKSKAEKINLPFLSEFFIGLT